MNLLIPIQGLPNSFQSFPVVSMFDACIEYANCWDIPRRLLITYYRSCLRYSTWKQPATSALQSKKNATKTHHFFYLSMVSSWSIFSLSPNFLKTMKLKIMKKMSKQNTKKGSQAEETRTVYHAAYVYALKVKKKTDLVRVFDLLLLRTKCLKRPTKK